MFTGEEVGTVDDLRSFSIAIQEHDGRGLLVSPPEPDSAS
jgi:hypothetical protein